MAAIKWLVWVTNVRVGDLAKEALLLTDLWYSSTFHRF